MIISFIFIFEFRIIFTINKDILRPLETFGDVWRVWRRLETWVMDMLCQLVAIAHPYEIKMTIIMFLLVLKTKPTLPQFLSMTFGHFDSKLKSMICPIATIVHFCVTRIVKSLIMKRSLRTICI